MNELIQDAIQHYEYGISHDIFSEPVATYARLAVKALQRDPEYEKLLKRWENVRIYEPGENVRTIGSNCEVLISGAELLALMNPEPRQLTLDELRQMVGQPVWKTNECDRTIPARAYWTIIEKVEDDDVYYSYGVCDYEFSKFYDRSPGGEG